MPSGGHAGRDLITQSLPVAAQLHEALATLGAGEFLHHGDGRGLDLRELLLQLGDLFARRLGLGGDVADIMILQQLELRRRALFLRKREGRGDLLLGDVGLGREPSVEAREPGRVGLRQDGFGFGQFPLEPVADRLLFRRDDLHRRALVALVGICRLVEDGVGAEVFGLRDRVVLVRVALRAGHRRAHPDRVGRVDAVDHGRDAELLIARAALVLRHRVAVERRGDQLVLGRVRQQVACELFDGEAVVGLVGVERADDPVAVRPDAAARVARVAGAVGIAREVEPAAGPVLAEGRLREVVVDDLALRGARETRQLGGRRRQAGEVEGRAADEQGLVGAGGEAELLLTQALEQERVDRVGLAVRGDRDRGHGFVGPVLAPRRALGDPGLEQGQLFGGNRLMLLRRRHDLLGVLRFDALDERAQLGLAGHDRDVAFPVGLRGGLVVEAQLGLARLLVGSVAGDAVLGEDGTDLAAEADGLGGVDQGQAEQGQECGTQSHEGERGLA